MGGESAETPSDFQDRTVWLIVFGLFEILLGLMAGGLGLLMLATQAAMQTYTQSGMGMAIGMYGLAAVFFICLGIGSILCRRWARALMLTCSSLWLGIGVVAFVTVLAILPQMDLTAASGGQKVPEGVMTFAYAFMMVMLLSIYIVLPGLFVLFYRSRHVKATCEWKDPKIRWTDRCPLPVLAMVILLAVGAVSCFGMGVSYPILPVPNGVVTGPLAVLTYLTMGALFAGLAWGFYRLRPWGWWTTLILMAVLLVYWICMLATGGFDMLAYYEAMGIPPKQMEMIKATGTLDLMESPTIVVLSAMWTCCYVGYVVYLKRFFREAALRTA